MWRDGDDRGNKLWEGHRMILPEHRRAMMDQEYEQLHFVPRPALGEDKLAEMSETIGAAMAKGRLVTVQIYKRYGPRAVTLLPKYFDEATRSLVGLTQLGEGRVRLPQEDIIDVNPEWRPGIAPRPLFSFLGSIRMPSVAGIGQNVDELPSDNS